MSKDLIDAGDYKALTKRGISEETCRKFGYTVSKYSGKTVHVAAFYDKGGSICAQHIRFPDKDFLWVGSFKHALLFGQHLWGGGGKRLVITEGEIDCMTISQLQGNKWPVVSVPSGSNGAAKAIREQLEWLESFEEVIFAFDMDEPGRTAANECAMLLTPGKAKVAHLPAKDANEALLAGKQKELMSALWEAKPYRPDGIINGADLKEKCRKPVSRGLTIPYVELSDMIQGIRPKELYLFTAGSGIGKSTIVNEIAYHMHQVHALPLGVIALEEGPDQNARRYLGIHLNKNLKLASTTMTDEEYDSAFEATVGRGDWWIYEHFGSTDVDGLIAKLRYMAVGLGVRVVVLDHISIVVSGLDEIAESERKVIDKLMTRLRSLIEETGITVLAVVHLKRPDKGKSYNEGRPVSLTDLRGSGSLEQLSDVVIALERNQQGDNPNMARIRVLKNRPIGTTGEAGAVLYDLETGRLSPADDIACAAFGFGDESGGGESKGADF